MARTSSGTTPGRPPYRVTNPDGRQWDVRIVAVRLPALYNSTFDPWGESDVINLLIALLVLAPLFWVVLPLARAIALLPFALLRPLFSSTRWVEATCRDPTELEIVWRTTRADGERVAAEIADRLEEGYDLDVAGARLESMTKPPGADDLLV
jgi:hypothetical protein